MSAVVTAPERLRRAYATFPTGVVALCGLLDGRPVGTVASSFNTLSLDPGLVGVAFAHSSRTWSRLRVLDRIGISVLGAGQSGLCRALAGPEPGRFTGVEWSAGASSAIYLAGSCQTLSCSLDQVVAVGDHQLAMLAVHEVGEGRGEPLVFHASTFRGLAAEAAA